MAGMGGAAAEPPVLAVKGGECTGELSNCSPIHRLTDKLLVEILHRLPCCKSATQCKTVCKRWLTLIDSGPLFVSRFLRRRLLEEPTSPPRLPFGIFVQYLAWDSNSRYGVRQFASKEPSAFQSSGFSLSFLPCADPDQIWILASYKDLLVCCPNLCDHSVYYLCNPLTKHWLALPPPPSHERARVSNITGRIRVGFVCEEPDSDENCAVRFKLVCIPPLLGNGSAQVEIEIFSSDTGQWSKSILQLPPSSNLKNFVINIVAYKGMLHWLDGRNGFANIVGFNPQYGDGMISTCHYIDRPSGSPRGIMGCLGVCRGRLRISLMQTRPDVIPRDESPCFRVWELKDYSSGEWSLLHKINFNQLRSENSYLESVSSNGKHAPIQALAFHPYDEDIMFLHFDKYVASCNLRTRRLQVASKVPMTSMGLGYHGVFPLVLPWWPTTVPRVIPSIDHLA